MDLEQEGVIGQQGLPGRVGQLQGNGFTEGVRLVAHAVELIVEQQGAENSHAAQDQQGNGQPQLPGYWKVSRHIGGQPPANAGGLRGAGLSLRLGHDASLIES